MRVCEELTTLMEVPVIFTVNHTADFTTCRAQSLHVCSVYSGTVLSSNKLLEFVC